MPRAGGACPVDSARRRSAASAAPGVSYGPSHPRGVAEPDHVAETAVLVAGSDLHVEPDGKQPGEVRLDAVRFAGSSASCCGLLLGLKVGHGKRPLRRERQPGICDRPGTRRAR